MFDLAIRNGLVVDGTRRAPFVATVYLKDDLIGAVCTDDSLPSANVIDVTGQVVAPGFIDLHTHSDAAVYCAPNFESAVYQGVTFNMVGNCGSSIVPNSQQTHDQVLQSRSRQYYVHPLTGKETGVQHVEGYAKEIGTRGVPINLATLVGHGTLRNEAMGRDNRAPTTHELGHMKELLREGLLQGAFGMSLGLTYTPGSYSNTAELIELASVLSEHRAMLAVHMRSEGAQVIDAVEEMLEIARQTGVKLHIAHLKLMWPAQWGKTGRLLALIDEGKAAGLDITADQYPYCASSTGMQSLLPPYAKQGTNEEFASRFADPEVYQKIIQAVEAGIEVRGGPERIAVANTRGLIPEADGKHLGQLALLWGVSPADAYCRVMLQCEGAASAIYHAIHSADMHAIMQRMDVAVASDGFAHDFLTGSVLGKPHPRSVGTFPRFLQVVRENKLMSLEDAVYKMTGLPASIMGLPEVGRLEVGCKADVTVFNYDFIEDRATFDNPSVKPAGISHVFVGGEALLSNGVQTEARKGRFYLRNA